MQELHSDLTSSLRSGVMLRTPVFLLLASLVLAGCSDGDSEAEPAPTVTVTVTAGVDPSPVADEEPEEDPYAPNLGDRALKIGETRQGTAVSTTVHEFRYPMPPRNEFSQAEGNLTIGLRIEQCVGEDADVTNLMTTYNGEWAVVTPSGDEFTGTGSYYQDWPTPKFPETVGVIAGRCSKGWITWEVPEGSKVASFLWRPQGVPVAEWIARS